MKLILTIHAKNRMDHHGITEKEIWNTLKMGAKTPQTDGFVAVYTYIRVAYKVRGENYIIKMVMIER